MSEKKHAFSPESMNQSSKDKKKLKFKKRVKLLMKQYPNDLELGKAVRSLLNKVDKTEGEEKPKKVKLSKLDNNENNYKETKKSKK